MKKFIVIIGWCYSSHEEEKVFFSMADAKKFAKKIQDEKSMRYVVGIEECN